MAGLSNLSYQVLCFGWFCWLKESHPLGLPNKEVCSELQSLLPLFFSSLYWELFKRLIYYLQDHWASIFICKIQGSTSPLFPFHFLHWAVTFHILSMWIIPLSLCYHFDYVVRLPVPLTITCTACIRCSVLDWCITFLLVPPMVYDNSSPVLSLCHCILYSPASLCHRLLPVIVERLPCQIS